MTSSRCISTTRDPATEHIHNSLFCIVWSPASKVSSYITLWRGSQRGKRKWVFPIFNRKREFNILGMNLVIKFEHWEWDLEKTFSWNLVFHQNLGWEMGSERWNLGQNLGWKFAENLTKICPLQGPLWK